MYAGYTHLYYRQMYYQAGVNEGNYLGFHFPIVPFVYKLIVGTGQ